MAQKKWKKRFVLRDLTAEAGTLERGSRAVALKPYLTLRLKRDHDVTFNEGINEGINDRHRDMEVHSNLLFYGRFYAHHWSDCFDIDELEDKKGYNKLVYLYPVLENEVYLRMKEFA